MIKNITKIAVLVGATLGVCSANAGSYQLNDYSVTGLGRSYAGQGIVGDDYSAIAFNPAGMTLMEKSGVQQAFNFVNLRADVNEIENQHNHKKMNFWQPVPAGFAQYNVNDRFKVGVGIYAPFGLKTQYDSSWFASDTAVLSKLDIVDFNLSAAYKLSEHWSIGASAILRYIYGRMTSTLAAGRGEINFNVHGWTQTGALGVMYELNKNTRFGLSWRLRSAQRAKGHVKISGNAPGHMWANPDLPETFTLSGYHRYQKLGFSGTARWTHWSSSFPEFTVRSDAPLMQYVYGPRGKVSTYRYKNSWTLTGGVDYYYCKNLTFRFGGGWDESPAHHDAHRTIRIPDNDRWWMSVGASYMKNNWQLDVGYAHMIGRTGKSWEVSDPAAKHAKYKNLQSHILGVQVQYKF